MRSLWFQQNVKEAIDTPRLHHQLEPMVFEYEFGTTQVTHISIFFPHKHQNDFPSTFHTQTLLDGLHKLGHASKRQNERGAIVCAIFKNDTGIFANADFRKKGDVVGLN